MISSQASPASPHPARIMALAPPPGLTQDAKFASALMPSLGGLTLLRLQLFGRYAFTDSVFHPCRTLEIDPNHIALSCQGGGHRGDRVDLDLDLLGVLHGVIEAPMAAGLRISVGDAHQDHIAERLAWFKACLGDGASDTEAARFRVRLSQRIVPAQTQSSFVDPDGGSHDAEILNISCSGAALRSAYPPLIGAPIILGKRRRRGLTVRRFDGGFAITFVEPIFAHLFGPDMLI